MANPRVFFDCTIGNEPAGRIVMEVRIEMSEYSKISLFRWLTGVFSCAAVRRQGTEDGRELSMPVHWYEARH
jgi:hypothetical protein